MRTKKQPKIEKESQRPEEKEGNSPSKHFVDLKKDALAQRSLASLIASRRCYECRNAVDEPPIPCDEQPYLERIVDHCQHTADYLLPDTPMKEAIFRVILMGGNQPINAVEISRILLEKWASTTYPRDLSVRVIQSLLDSSHAYRTILAPEEATEEDKPRRRRKSRPATKAR